MLKTIAIILPTSSLALQAQIKVELLRRIVYRNQAKRLAGVEPDFVLSYHQFRRYYDYRSKYPGKIIVETHSGVIVEGGFDFHSIYPQGKPWIPGLSALFPPVQTIKKIECFDQSGKKVFEDNFEYAPMYDFELLRTSENSFKLPRNHGGVYYSIDGAKTWDEVLNVGYITGTFTLSNEVANNPDIVILATARNPTPPYNPGVYLWSNKPGAYVLEFPDGEPILSRQLPQYAPNNNPNPPRNSKHRIHQKEEIR